MVVGTHVNGLWFGDPLSQLNMVPRGYVDSDWVVPLKWLALALLDLRFSFQPVADLEPVQLFAEILCGEVGSAGFAANFPGHLDLIWFKVPISSSNPRTSAYFHDVFLDLFVKLSVFFSLSIFLAGIETIHVVKMHFGFTSPRDSDL